MKDNLITTAKTLLENLNSKIHSSKKDVAIYETAEKNIKVPAYLIQYFMDLVDDLQKGKEIALDWFFGLKSDLNKTIKGKIWHNTDVLDVSLDDLNKINDWLENFDYDSGLAYDNNDNAKFVHSLPVQSFQRMRAFLRSLEKN